MPLELSSGANWVVECSNGLPVNNDSRIGIFVIVIRYLNIGIATVANMV